MIIKNSKPISVWKNKSVLGEGTLWAPTLNSIFFVDIKKKENINFRHQNKQEKNTKSR